MVILNPKNSYVKDLFCFWFKWEILEGLDGSNEVIWIYYLFVAIDDMCLQKLGKFSKNYVNESVEPCDMM